MMSKAKLQQNKQERLQFLTRFLSVLTSWNRRVIFVYSPLYIVALGVQNSFLAVSV